MLGEARGAQARAMLEADAAAIQAVFDEEGQRPAAIELRRHFVGFIDNATARECARIIAGWTSPKIEPWSVMPLRLDRKR